MPYLKCVFSWIQVFSCKIITQTSTICTILQHKFHLYLILNETHYLCNLSVYNQRLVESLCEYIWKKYEGDRLGLFKKIGKQIVWRPEERQPDYCCIAKKSWLRLTKFNGSMGLGFFNLKLRQRHWDVKWFCIQLGNREDR